MCGIYGILQLDGAPADPALMSAMGRVTTHRGPDDEGLHADGACAIGMRRLSIIDLAGGHQPLSNADGTLWLVCNGEIYNFRELRRELEALGHRFKTASDSEVMLHGYAQWGDEFVHRLNGMFGFALWDARRRRLILGRDRLGHQADLPLPRRATARVRLRGEGAARAAGRRGGDRSRRRCIPISTSATSRRRNRCSAASPSCRRRAC